MRADAVVVGAGIVGACCADALAAAGLDVVVVERSSIAGGTTAAGEGNLLVSDKEPGPELALAQRSGALWRRLAEELDDDIELEPKGGLIVATTDAGRAGMTELAARQAAAGVTALPLQPDEIRALEPHLSHDVVSGVHYPEDMQVQPVRAAAAILRRARRAGARLLDGTEVREVLRDGEGRVTGVDTAAGRISAPLVVNAAGAWSAAVARRAGVNLPVAPRRGHILVTEALPLLVRRKVYDADYVGAVGSDAAEAQLSSVVEGTPAGTILIGSSRELVGFDRTLSVPVLARLADRAIRLFPVLADVRLIRAYLGFRPFAPDHLPVIGPDERVPGLWHATGHEGAGIGLAPATGELLAALVTGAAPPLDPRPFDPGRPALRQVAADA